MTSYSIIPENCQNPKTSKDFIDLATISIKSDKSWHDRVSDGSFAYAIVAFLANKCERFQWQVELLECEIEKIRSQQDYFRQKAREGEAVPGLNKIIVEQAAKIAELEKDLIIARKINFPE